MCGCNFEQFVAGNGRDGKGKMVLGGFCGFFIAIRFLVSPHSKRLKWMHYSLFDGKNTLLSY
jgi:hypothetical protein